MKNISLILFFLMFIFSCSDKDDSINIETLEAYIINRAIETSAVIACAASDEVTQDVLVFYYPETFSTNIRFYETINSQDNPDNYTNFKRAFPIEEPFFNGYLGKFIRDTDSEKWIIITYELNGTIRISNPIRTKQVVKPTVWTDQVSINQQSQTQNFVWIDNAYGGNAIYFQVVSDDENNLLSGTYTYENEFTYYNTDNVILNITQQIPPSLNPGDTYKFTLMDVSEDNWVNLIIQKTFIAQ